MAADSPAALLSVAGDAGTRTRMHATAAVGTALRTGAAGRPQTRIVRLRSEAPLKLQRTIAKEPEPWAAHADGFARACLAAGAAGPVGGDRLRLTVDVGPRSALVLTEVSSTLLLPGFDGARSRTDVRIRVDAGGTLIWLPEPVIAARGCDHLNDVEVDLAPDARLLIREEALLGRHGEPSGILRQRVRVRRGGHALYAQDLELGSGLGRSPAVAGPHHAVGSLLVVDPERTAECPVVGLAAHAVLLPLCTDAVLVSALADDNLSLRSQLTAGLRALGPPWDPTPTAADAKNR